MEFYDISFVCLFFIKITDICSVTAFDQNPALAASIVPRIYRYDLTYLRLGCQTVSFDEFKIFGLFKDRS